MTKLSLPIEVLTMFQNKCTPELKKTKTKKKLSTGNSSNVIV